MWPILETLLHRTEKTLQRHNVEWALALHRRDEVRSDGLKPISLSSHLEIEWRARKIHPWDGGRRWESDSLFVEQSLADTDAAITRLFEALPHIDAIMLRILHPSSEAAIIAGTVYRSAAFDMDGSLSFGMRLKKLGLRFRSTGVSLEPLEADAVPDRPDKREASAELLAYFLRAGPEQPFR
jgi:hypothetical protein